MSLVNRLLILVVLFCLTCSNSLVLAADPPTDKPTIAFVTNQIASFWNIAEVGVKDAGEDFGVEVDVRFPNEATATKQKQIVEDLLSSGIDALAISPIDAVNQREMMNQWAGKIPPDHSRLGRPQDESNFVYRRR